MAQRGTPAFFLVFWSVSLNFKNEEEGHRAFFPVTKHQKWRRGTPGLSQAQRRPCRRASPAGMNEQVRHRAVQALEGEPGKVARAGADTTQRHLGHALGGKAGNEAVAQVAHAADVDVAHRVVVGAREDGEEVEVLRGLCGYCRLPSCICDSRRLSSCLAAPMGATSCPGLARKGARHGDGS